MHFVQRALSVCLLSAASFCTATAQHAPSQATSTTQAPSLILNGDVHPADAQTYIEAPFRVPAGTHRITVRFENLGREQHTVLDLGILDPLGFRGASGGNKQQFTIGESDATPSYLPGAIPAGTWKLLLAVPNIRAGVTSHWRAEVWFNRSIDDAAFVDHPLRSEAGWYRGDLHMHTAHSDGSCASQSGKQVPCPLFITVETAARRGLDFIAISDHNTTSHYNDERELQPFFDRLLLIPAREVTTFYGHANMFGTTRFLDYRAAAGGPRPRSIDDILRDARDLGAIVSINHPQSATGEVCMGCGWTPPAPNSMDLVSAVELQNGHSAPATTFWQQQLRSGHRLSAIGGSDNHHGDVPLENSGSIGSPTTVVYAASLSVADILAGIRSGRVFIDLNGTRDRLVDLQANAGAASANMGDSLAAAAGTTVDLSTHVAACDGDTVKFYLDGEPSADLPPATVHGTDATLPAHWRSDGARHWLRVEVLSAEGTLLLLSNPVYINFPAATARP